MASFVPSEKAFPIRQPSTANLMIDSVDRNNLNNTTAADFSINKNNSILNGFFTRIATSEVVFDWLEPNVSDITNTASVDISGGTNHPITISPGFYTVAQYIDAILLQFNDISGATGTLFTTNASPPYIQASNPAVSWRIVAGLPVESLNLTAYVPAGGRLYLDGLADLREYRYIDFVSSDLTLNQELKDGSTNVANRDVLCRWYFEWDNPPSIDKYGYPIQMGYNSFMVRRIFSPPKQIKWDPSQPIGQLSFQLFTNGGLIALQPLVLTNPLTNWRMTLQVSEV